MKLLLDTNIFLEIILGQEKAQEARDLLSRVGKYETAKILSSLRGRSPRSNLLAGAGITSLEEHSLAMTGGFGVCTQTMSGNLLPAPSPARGFTRKTPPGTAAGAFAADNLCVHTVRLRLAAL